MRTTLIAIARNRSATGERVSPNADCQFRMALDYRYPARRRWMSSLDGVFNRSGLLKSAARALIGVAFRRQTSDFRQIGVSSPDSIQVHHHSGTDGLTIFFLRGLPRAALVLSQTTGRGDGREVKLDPEERIITAALDEPELDGANEGGARARIEFMPEGDAKVTITISRELVEEARTLDLTTWELFAEALRLAIPGAFELARPLPPTLH